MALVLALPLAGCQSQANYEAGVAEMKKNPAAKAYVVSECAAKIDEYPVSSQRKIAASIGVSAVNVSTTFCQRLVNLMISGKLSYRDYVDVLGMPYSEEDKLYRKMRRGG